MAALLVLQTAVAAAQEPLTPSLNITLKPGGRLLGVEERGRCLVVSQAGTIQVLRPSGEVWWHWPYGKISRSIAPQTAAVSHTCDAIAVPGQPGYKFTWIVDRGGKSVTVTTQSVPVGAAFDRTGALVVVGTSGGTLSLFTRQGELRWKRDVPGALVFRNLEFTDDNYDIVSSGWAGPAVVGADGTVRWAQLAAHLSVSRDLKTLVFGDEPNHGPGYSSFTVTDADRKTLFQRFGGVHTWVSSTGHRILATVSPLPEELIGRMQDESQGGGVQLLDRTGKLVARFDGPRRPIALSEDGTRMWLGSNLRLDCVDDRGTVLASIAVNGGQRDGDEARVWLRTFVSRGFERVVTAAVYDGITTVQAFTVPDTCRQ